MNAHASQVARSTQRAPIVDSFGRVHNSLRISVTDRCNIRCFYCMPEVVRFLPRDEVLTFEEIRRVAGVAASMGVDKIRLTGGEPLVRGQIHKLIAMLKSVPGIREVGLTTNGILLAEQASALADAGLDRINVSLDTINPAVFERLTRRRGLEKVLEGIAAAQAVGLKKLRLNAVSIAGVSESEIVPLARFAREHQLELRFIEFMPLDGDGNWQSGQVLSGEQVRTTISKGVAPLVPVHRNDASQPAVDFQYVDRPIRVGFINSITQPFCSNCNRMRISAEGKFRNCLFANVEWDLRPLLRGDAGDDQIALAIRECVAAKKAAHGIDSDQFQRPERAMYQIGG